VLYMWALAEVTLAGVTAVVLEGGSAEHTTACGTVLPHGYLYRRRSTGLTCRERSQWLSAVM
jgi:hypothetical protein